MIQIDTISRSREYDGRVTPEIAGMMFAPLVHEAWRSTVPLLPDGSREARYASYNVFDTTDSARDIANTDPDALTREARDFCATSAEVVVEGLLERLCAQSSFDTLAVYNIMDRLYRSYNAKRNCIIFMHEAGKAQSDGRDSQLLASLCAEMISGIVDMVPYEDVEPAVREVDRRIVMAVVSTLGSYTDRLVFWRNKVPGIEELIQNVDLQAAIADGENIINAGRHGTFYSEQDGFALAADWYDPRVLKR